MTELTNGVKHDLLTSNTVEHSGDRGRQQVLSAPHLEGRGMARKPGEEKEQFGGRIAVRLMEDVRQCLEEWNEGIGSIATVPHKSKTDFVEEAIEAYIPIFRAKSEEFLAVLSQRRRRDGGSRGRGNEEDA